MASIYLLRRDPAAAPATTAALTGLGLVVTTVAAVAGAGAALGVGALGVPGLLGVVVLACALLAAATVAVEQAGATLLGLGLNQPYAATEAIRGFGILVGTAVSLAVSPSPTGFVVGAALGLLAATFFARSRLRRVTGSLRPTIASPTWREALGYGLRGQVGNVLQFVALRLDLVLVAAVLGPVAAGIYLVATRVSEVVTQIANAASMLLFPAVAGQAAVAGRTAGDGPGGAAGGAFTASTIRSVALAVAGSAVVVGIGSWLFLPLVFGAEYAAGLPALGLLLVAAVPLSVGRLLASDLKGRGRPGLVSLAAVVGLAITVAGNLALLGEWGIEAAAAVSIAAYGANAIGLALAWRRIGAGSLGDLVPGPADGAAVLRRARESIRRRG